LPSYLKHVRNETTKHFLVGNTKINILKQNKGLFSFTLEIYPCINKNFWWFRFFLIYCGGRDINLKMSKMKQLSAFQLAT